MRVAVLALPPTARLHTRCPRPLHKESTTPPSSRSPHRRRSPYTTVPRRLRGYTVARCCTVALTWHHRRIPLCSSSTRCSTLSRASSPPRSTWPRGRKLHASRSTLARPPPSPRCVGREPVSRYTPRLYRRGIVTIAVRHCYSVTPWLPHCVDMMLLPRYSIVSSLLHCSVGLPRYIVQLWLTSPYCSISSRCGGRRSSTMKRQRRGKIPT